jgi:hypothetical protein
MNNPVHISESVETIFLGLKYLNSLTRIRDGKNGDPGWKKWGSGMEKIRIRIPDPQHCLKVKKIPLC